MFCVIQSSTSNTVFFNRFINARDNGVFSIGSIISVVNPDTIKDYMNGVLIFFEQTRNSYATNESLTDFDA